MLLLLTGSSRWLWQSYQAGAVLKTGSTVPAHVLAEAWRGTCGLTSAQTDARVVGHLSCSTFVSLADISYN